MLYRVVANIEGHDRTILSADKLWVARLRLRRYRDAMIQAGVAVAGWGLRIERDHKARTPVEAVQ